MIENQNRKSVETLSPKGSWVVVVAKPGCERRAKLELTNQGFETYLPMRRSLNRRREVVTSPFFPRYLFARVDLSMTAWRAIWSSYGVQGMLGSVNRPFAVQDWVVERIQRQEEEGFIAIGQEAAAPRFTADEQVRLAGCPDLEAIFLEAVDERRGLILVSLLGRDSRTVVDLNKLRSAKAETDIAEPPALRPSSRGPVR